MELTCEICYNDFGEEIRRPRMLSCGHTHCQSCIEKFIQSRSPCPMCKVKIKQTHVIQIPINFYVVAMLKNKLKPNGHCLEHSCPNHFMCMKCYKLMCGTCVAMNHKNCETVEASDALPRVQVDQTSDLEAQIKLLQESNEEREKYIKGLSVSLKYLKESTYKVETNLEKENKLKKENESKLKTLKNLNDEMTSVDKFRNPSISMGKDHRVNLEGIPKSEIFDFLKNSPARFCRVSPKFFHKVINLVIHDRQNALM